MPDFHPYDNVGGSVHVMNFSETDPLLNFYANFVVHWVQIWVLESQAWWNKRGCVSHFEKFEMGDGSKRTHKRSRTRQADAVESKARYGNACQITWITLSKWMNFDVNFCNRSRGKMTKVAF